ncbi:MAG: 4-hydroxy-tetrahydrodipicolinate reductase [Treponema sp.]|jgi:4-hydroxy-tetrahydrodipicolinate reductase|nr:4-hydroxy-tetrahydrodipicolinate reductase [Treponema sp.]
MMKIGLVGYGKMGKMIERIAMEKGHSISAIVEPHTNTSIIPSGAPVYSDIASAILLIESDVVIEFTHPTTALANIKALAEKKLPVVVGTTGWHDHLDEVSSLVEKAGTSLLWSSNFSLGVNLFYEIAAFAAMLMDSYTEYDVGGWESHHNKKADSPSGTAKMLVELVLKQMTRKTKAVYETLEHRPPAAEELHFPSLRVGSVPGTHTMFFDSPADTIEITHTARNREGLASGAVSAAEWLAAAERKGMFTMQDVMERKGR